MLRRILLVACAASSLMLPASAGADFQWTGFYAGINAGYGSGQFRLPAHGTFSAPPDSSTLSGKLSLDGSGFLGGGQVGYNYLFSNNWVIGFEADASGTTISPQLTAAGVLDPTGTYDLDFRSSLDFLGTARARLGYVLPRNMLVYATAGLAYGGVSTDAVLHLHNGSDTTNITLDRFAVDVGWSAGAGVEYPVTDRLSLRAEYLYADLGSHTVVSGTLVTGSVSGTGSINAATSAHIGRIALNYAL